jgi:hypothetical protein
MTRERKNDWQNVEYLQSDVNVFEYLVKITHHGVGFYRKKPR